MVPMILVWVLIFIVALTVLLKSSDYFTEAAEKIGLKLGIPAFIVGVTIVAVGTSLPELISSLIAANAGASEIVIGNVVGSNIANILLVLGVVAIFSKKIKTDYELHKVDLPIFFASALFLVITCFDGVFTMGEGIIGILGVITYFTFAASYAKQADTSKDKKSRKERLDMKKMLNLDKKELKKEGLKLQFIILLISGFFIYLGAKYTVSSVIELSEIFNIGKELIAVSAVAIGTSLPELTVGIQAARKGNSGMAFGNVLGSNIFNTFAVMGIPALFHNLIVPTSMVLFSLPVLMGVSLLYYFAIQDNELTIWEGIFFILAYILYMGKIFGLI